MQWVTVVRGRQRQVRAFLQIPSHPSLPWDEISQYHTKQKAQSVVSSADTFPAKATWFPQVISLFSCPKPFQLIKKSILSFHLTAACLSSFCLFLCPISSIFWLPCLVLFSSVQFCPIDFSHHSRISFDSTAGPLSYGSPLLYLPAAVVSHPLVLGSKTGGKDPFWLAKLWASLMNEALLHMIQTCILWPLGNVKYLIIGMHWS